jgi:thiol-disulfide isomerase/thioredoxin
MATPSKLLPLGTRLPQVRLENAVDGAEVDVDQLSAQKRGTVVLFVCNHCPYVVHIRRELVRAAHEALDQGFAVVAINSNDENAYPQDGPSEMAKLARQEGWRFPFLFDRSQDVARAFQAACTPEIYLFDNQRKLAYHGQFDDSRPSNGKPVTGRDLRAALEAVAAGKAPPEPQMQTIGCNIKWKG